MNRYVLLLIFLAIISPFFSPLNAHGGIDIDLNLPIGFKSISPVQFSIVRDDHFVLKGRLMGDFRISSVSIKGTEARIDDENGFEFSDIQMKEGLNTFLISMTDINGRRRLVSYSVYSEPRGPMAGGGIASVPVIDVGAAAEGYTVPPRKKLSTRVERRTEQPKKHQNGKNQDVVFSSPFSGQVITEKELKIGGRFNLAAGISSITVNGQPCTLNMSTGTFEGPMLICPGKAREYNVNADSPKYILMRVDPVTHSGENILRVKIAGDNKTYEDRIVYNYYQLFVYSSTNNRIHVKRYVLDPLTGEYVIVPEDYDYYNTDAFNSDLLRESPFSGWADLKYDTRDIYPIYSLNIHQNNYGRYNYYDKGTAYYSIGSYPWIAGSIFFYDGLYNVQDGATREDTISVTLHSPPRQIKKYMVIFNDCCFIETSNMFWKDKNWWNTPLDVSKYKANGISMSYLSEPLIKKEPQYLCKPLHTYVIFDNDDDSADKDYQLKIDAPSYPGFASSPGPVTKLFSADIKYGITGDILVDSNNDGFLGRDDNIEEQNMPGCVFWVNNDDDYDEMTKIHQDDPNAKNSKDKDGSDVYINGIRDLEDFLPINITIPNIKEWSSYINVKICVKTEGNGKIRIFPRVQGSGIWNETSYLNNINASIKQISEENSIAVLSEQKQYLNLNWFDSDGKFLGIFEGIYPGNLDFILSLEIDNKEELELDRVSITLKDIRDMYRLVNVRKGPRNGNGDQLTRYRDIESSGGTYSTDNSRVFIWAHGYNTSIRKEGQKVDSRTDSLIVLDTVYKRMYRTGFRGPFIGITWHGDEGAVADFNSNWENSFQTGQVVADALKDIRKEYNESQIDLNAHSLGNNVFCYAVKMLSKEQNPIIDNIIFSQAAIPAETYSGDDSWRNERFADPMAFHAMYFYDMYGMDLSAVKGKVYNTWTMTDNILLGAFTANDVILGFKTPLDDDYMLTDSARYFSCRSTAIGLMELKNKYSREGKIMNYNYYNNASKHPYGIRSHGSMMDEYYSDVKEYYEFLLTLKSSVYNRKD